jgi:SAM-dependent methyltransferase
MELGPGDCSLSFELCKYFKKVYAIDVSNEITKNSQKPTNFELIISDGSSVNMPPGSIDVAYSNQLMEHLHPDDAIEQVQGIYKALVSGGVYICLTPYLFTGPHDISKYFDDVATGFHLKEYTNEELYSLCKSVGFRKIHSYQWIKGIGLKIPIYPAIMAEYLISPLPHSVRKNISRKLLIRHLLGISLIATK